MSASTSGPAPSIAASPKFPGVPLLSQLPELPSLEGADPLRNPIDAFRLAIAHQLAGILNLDLQKVYDGVQVHTKGADFIATLPRFRLPGKPMEWAEKVEKEFKPDAYIETAKAQKGGFVWFTAVTNTLSQLTLSTINALSRGEYAGSKEGGSYGTNVSGVGKDLIVEFSSPNIAKPFHAGHLRSTIIGAFLANLYEANGWYVERWNYLGDWGKQFGLLAVAWGMYGDEAALKEDAVKHLYDIYVRINREAEEHPEYHDQARAFFKKMEDDDPAALALWQKFRDLSIAKYKDTYARLNVHFDVYSGESQVTKQSISEALTHIKTSDYIEKADNGAYLIDLNQYKLDKTVIERQDGTPLYITRDIGEAKQRWDTWNQKRGKGFDKMIYVIATQQNLHLAQFFKVLELMGYDWAQPEQQRLLHINFGLVKGMSTRKGTAVFLDHILDEAGENMHNVMKSNEDKYKLVAEPEKTADVLGMTAVKIQDMTGKRINDYNFDWNRMLSFEGDTGPYLQYNHTRLCSVERKVQETDGLVLSDPLDPSTLRLDLLSEPKARDLVMLLAQWPEVVRRALDDLQPSTIVQYCFKLCHSISSAWEVLLVKGQERDLALARLFAYRCARDVLSAAMRLLTLQPLQRM
ncbi:arginyl-tRNA synthetase [Ceraceosorus guamensis]|uniref:arginine--tRNA ligase n=1 Tax=Ceraceosorus guamensis TaxID=1522189 RepID=A0A316W594_9BASI|nr:arginyl-tRNA synthetase [Ceraceosorus guamensis]PWN42805.1 arginyl-tRNA synthetase [Ceraceosorus guamensis]